MWWRWHSSRPTTTTAGADRDADLDEPRSPDPGYVGPQACGACHAARLAEFRQTRHFRACWAHAGFTPKQETVASRNPGLRFQIAQSGDDLFQTLIRVTPAGEERYTSRIDLVYGSGGKADEVFFTWKGDRLYELPLGWLHSFHQWGEQPFDPQGRGDLTRTTTTRCVECHTTWLEHVAGTENEYRRAKAILGVTCEKCHGPGRDHVGFHREHPDAKGNHAVVHPGKLSRDRLMDVCGQCHSNAIYPRGPAFSYRPGEPLDAHFRTLTPTGIESDHVADQVRDLRQSKCYQKSDKLTCITCHNPHRPSSADTTGSRACATCHQPADCREQAHLPAGSGSNCVACHMPTYNRVAVKFHTTNEQYIFPMRPHQHRIAVYPAARDEVLLDWLGKQPDLPSQHRAAELKKSLVEHWLAEGDRLRQDHRFMASIGAIREALRLGSTPEARAKLKEVVAIQAQIDADFGAAQRQASEGRHAEAIRSLESVLRLKPDHAGAHGRLGALYANAGKRAEAVEHLQAVAKYDPNDAYGYNMLGWLAFLDGDGAAAEKAFRRADEILPFSAEINYRWGLALRLQERWPDAEGRFRQVLTIDPNHAGGYQGLSDALRRQGHLEEAVRLARRAARLTDYENADVLITLVEAYAAAGRRADADKAAAQALEVARRNNPESAAQIQARLDKIKARSR
jgi:tetratricopeptide (TPR) repeat protein